MAKPLHDWDLLRETWLNQNLVDREGPYTLKMLAEDHDLDYSYLQNKAAKEGWTSLLKDAQAKASKKAKNAIERSKIFNELETRVRQATYGNLAQSKAAVKLNNIDPEKLTVREAIDLMRLGTELERKALAMPDHFVYTEVNDVTEEGFTKPKAQQLLDKLVGDVMELVKQEDGTYAVADGDDHPESSGHDSQ